MAENPRSPLLARWMESAKRSGPGWLLSAYTLGSGSAVGSLWAGYKYGYSLLWVQPVAMLMGVIVLSGAAYTFVYDEERPYRRFWSISPALALAWALGSLFSSVIWHFPQYSLAYNALREVVGFENTTLNQVLAGGAMLAFSIALTWSNAKGSLGPRIYEILVKLLVWMMLICLAIVVCSVHVDWGAALRGLCVWQRPDSNVLFFAMLSAAVGINMTFLYPYSVQQKEWDEQTDGFRIAVKDLFTGMMLPFICATGLMILAAAATASQFDTPWEKGNISQWKGIFEPVFGSRLGPLLFYLGILAMPLSSITLHMLTSGFIVSEMLGQPRYSLAWKLGTLCPAIGVLGVAYGLPAWLPVSASALCLIFLPIAYVGFILCFQREVNTPREGRTSHPKWLLWPMILVLLVISVCAIVQTGSSLGKLQAMMHPAAP